MKAIDKTAYTGARYKEFLNFWKDKLEQLSTPFIFGEAGPAVTSDADLISIRKTLSYELTHSLDIKSKKSAANEVVLFVSALTYLLSEFTGADDVAIKTRCSEATEYGSDVRDVLLIQNLNELKTIRELILATEKIVSSSYKYQNFPIGTVRPGADFSADDLTTVSFYHQDFHAGPPNKRSAINFSVARQNEQFVIEAEYAAALFQHREVEHFLESLEVLLTHYSEVDKPLSGTQYIPEALKDQLVHEYNQTEVARSNGQVLIDLISDRMRTSPGQVAVICKEKSYTFSFLDDMSARLASYLQSEAGVRAGDRVGILMESSEHFIVGLLGILKTGATYVPLDPNWPNERIGFILKDSSPATLIVNSSNIAKIGDFEGPVFVMDYQVPVLPKAPVNAVVTTPTDGAYMIYTSGSTGRPKGVEVLQQGILNSILWCCEYYKLDSSHRRIQLASVAFDASVMEIFSCLVSGASMVIPDTEFSKDTAYLSGLIERYGVTHLLLTPTFYQSLLQDDINLKLVQVVTLVGEAYNSKLVDKHYKRWTHVRLMNEYGPTENSVCSTFCEIPRGVQRAVIGKPISNVKVFVLSKRRNLLPAGIIGELALSGAGVANGYWHDEAKTAGKFIENPFGGGRMYLTGDVARWLSYGEIEFAGRRDDQVSIRGYRIELGEIRNTLLSLPEVDDAVLISVDLDGSPAVVATIVSTGEIDVNALKEELMKSLPGYMVPNHFIVVGKLPSLPNGKLDRQELLRIINTGLRSERVRKAPSTYMEQELHEIWSSVLDKHDFDLEDNFFDIGGHSLRAIQVISRIKSKLAIDVDVNELFANPTILGLAIILETKKGLNFNPIPVVEKAEYYDVSNAQKGLWIQHKFGGVGNANNMAIGYEMVDLDDGALERAFQSLVERHEILRTNFVQRNGELLQKVRSIADFPFKVLHVHVVDSANRGAEIRKYIEQFAKPAFDLENDSLLRAVIIHVSDRESVFVLSMHHIISDGWSLKVLTNEILALYNAYKHQQPDPLPPLRIQYKDYVYWLKDQLKGGELGEHRSYWKEQLSGKLPVLSLVTDNPRPSVKTYNGELLALDIDKETTEKLHKLSRSHNVTFFTTLLSTLNAFLYTYTGQEEVIVGTPIVGRGDVELEGQIGLYLNTLPLRVKFQAEDSFESLISTVRDITLDAFRHEAYPFDSLLIDLGLAADPSREPLFDVMIDLENIQVDAQVDHQFTTTIAKGQYPTGLNISKFDVHFTFGEGREGLRVILNYNTDLFARNRMVSLLENYRKVVQSIVSEPTRPLHSLYEPMVKDTDTEIKVSELNNKLGASAILNFGIRSYDPNSDGRYLSSTKKLDDEVVACIKQITCDEDLSRFAAVLSGISYLLSEYTANTEIVIKTPPHRDYPAYGYIHSVAVSNSIGAARTIDDLIGTTRKILTSTYGNQGHPLSEFTAYAGNSKFTNVSVSYDRIHDTAIADSAVNFSLVTKGSDLVVEVLYQRALFDDLLITEFLENLNMLLANYRDTTSSLNALRYLTPHARAEVADTFNQTDTTFKLSGTTLTELICDQLSANADNRAVVFNGKSHSYRYMDDLSDRLCVHLQQEMTVGPGTHVGVMMESSEVLLISMLAIFKARAVYVPIDPGLPADRIAFMMADAALMALIVDERSCAKIGDFNNPIFVTDYQLSMLEPAQRVEQRSEPGDTAYIIYTSGSTGKPKGVEVTQSGIANTIKWSVDYYNLDQSLVRLQLASVAFDASLMEIFSTIVAGGTLVIPDRGLSKDVIYINQLIREHQVTHLLMTPAFYQALIAEEIRFMRSVKAVTLVGEAYTHKLVREHMEKFPSVSLINEYGPTENSICATYTPIEPERSSVIIGKPIANTKIYIVNRDRNILPVGAIGEIAISGKGVAKGYLNENDLSGRKFIVSPFDPKERLYLSGDMGRWSRDGKIEFLGRRDDQVSIRGNRIELGEIKNALLSLDGIFDAVVTTHGDDAPLLVACLVTSRKVEVAGIRKKIADMLPKYMVPTSYIFIDTIPLLFNGKLDSAALKKIIEVQLSSENTYKAPATQLEKDLHTLWSGVLDRKDFGVSDNFFDLGGHSLRALQLISRVHNDFGVRIELDELFANSNIDSMARFIDAWRISQIDKMAVNNGGVAYKQLEV